MNKDELIKRLEKEFGIEFSKAKGLSYWNNGNIVIRVVDNDVSKYADCKIDGITDTNCWFIDFEQATDETIDKFISKIKSHLPHLPKVVVIEEENISTMIDEIKNYQKKINILLNRIETKSKENK